MPGYEQDTLYGRRPGMTPRNPGIVDIFFRALEAKQAKANIEQTKANAELLGAETAYRRAGIQLTEANIPLIRAQARNMDADTGYKGAAAEGLHLGNEKTRTYLEHYANVLNLFVTALNAYRQEPEKFMQMWNGFGNPGMGRE